MRKVHIILMVVAMALTQQVFADMGSMMASDSNDKSCGSLAQACLAAGFVRTESSDKNIWFHCMKPILLGQTVTGVTIDVAIVKTCRTDKIEKIKTELKELEKAN